MEKDIEDRAKYELRLAKDICSILLKEYDGSSLDEKFYTNSLDDLKKMKLDKISKLENLQNLIWEKNIHKSLNTEDYFIPNKDIKDLKNFIKSLGIHVETGIEYLQSIDIEEKNRILSETPSFLYSLVVASEKEWSLIEKNIDDKLLLYNLVPIYIRALMGKENQVVYKFVNNKTISLAEERSFIRWKESLDEDYTNLERIKEDITKDIGRIDGAINNIVILISRGLVFDLSQNLRLLGKEIISLKEDIGKDNETLASLSHSLNIENKNLDKTNDRILGLEKRIDLLEDYSQYFKYIGSKGDYISGLKDKIKDLYQEISNIDDAISSYQENSSEVDSFYYKWTFDKDELIKKLRKYIGNLDYSFDLNKDFQTSSIPSFILDADLINISFNERESLEKDLISRNHQVDLINNEIKNLLEKLEAKIDDLRELNISWQNYDDLGLSLIEIDMRIRQLMVDIEKLDAGFGSVNSKLSRLDGEISIQKDSLIKTERLVKKDHKKSVQIMEIEDYDLALYRLEEALKSNGDFKLLCELELESHKEKKVKLEINLSKIDNWPYLDFAKGKLDIILKEKINNNIDMVVEDWKQRTFRNEQEIKKTLDEGERLRQKFLRLVRDGVEEEKLKKKIISTIEGININNFLSNKESFASMKEHFSKELLSIRIDKEKAEDAMNQWTHRASIHVIRMVETLKDMINSMNYINDSGIAFPLVKLRGIERLPLKEEEVSYLLRDHFIEAISKVIKEKDNIENLDNKSIEEYVGDSKIFAKALQGRYPVLLVYKMTENNEFKYARPRDEHYATWEAINRGEGISTEGSGGQTLSITTFVTMMIMSFRKKNIGVENPSTVLLLDNPFGKASGKHVLDPIFEIADKLNFQLITFAAPEIIKVEISERFPIFWDLQIDQGKIVHGGRVFRE